MLQLTAVLTTLLLTQQAVMALDGICRECICANSNGHVGDASQCAMPAQGDCLNGIYCGPYGMTSQYWTDVGSKGGDFYGCMADWDCANKTLDAYEHKYCSPQFVHHSAPCSCEEQARIHHCGPYSIHAPFCDDYWNTYLKPCIDAGL